MSNEVAVQATLSNFQLNRELSMLILNISFVEKRY